MPKRLFLLCAICLALGACDRRARNNPPTLPAPVVETTIAINAPDTPAGAQTASEPAQLSPLSTATPPLESAQALAPESDPLGDEIEQLLAQLDSANTAADRDIEQLPAP